MPKRTPSPGVSSPLAGLQRALAHAVMRPLGAREAMRRENRDVAARIVQPNDRLTSFERLQIYNQQYWWRLLGSFAEDFRGLRAVLGERKFDRLAVSYLTDCGSAAWNLRDLGQHLEAYLRQHKELTSPHSPLALEMARVEWARVIAFDGHERPKLDPQKIAHKSPSRIRLSLQPYLTLLELSYPIDDLCRRLKRIEAAPASNAMSGTIRSRRLRLRARRTSPPIYLAVHRLDFSVYYKRLEPEAYRILVALNQGETLDAACVQAFNDSEEMREKMALKVQTWFAAWIRFGWLGQRTARSPRFEEM